MPHDVKGRLIERGDYVRVQTCAGMKLAEVAHVNAASDSFNVQASYMVPGAVINASFNARDCELAMKADGSEP